MRRLIDLSIRRSLLGPTFDITFMQLAVGLSIVLIRPIKINLILWNPYIVGLLELYITSLAIFPQRM